MLVPPGMLNSELWLEGDQERGLAAVENLPEFMEEDGPWYFGRIGGKFYASNIHFIDESTAYEFDMNTEEGWKEIDTLPAMEYAMPEIYRQKSNGSWEINKEALRMTRSLELNPDDVLIQSLNVLHGRTIGDTEGRRKLLDAFAGLDGQGIEGMTIPFPQLEDVEILLDTEEHQAQSLTVIQDYLHTAYVQRFPGLRSDTVKWLAGDIGERFLQNLLLQDQAGNAYVVDQHGKPIDREFKYVISSKAPVDNFIYAASPNSALSVLITAEREFSDETQARIDQIHGYIQGMMDKAFGIAQGFLSRFGALGVFATEMMKEYTTQPLGDIWALSEELALEWEEIEKERGSLTFKQFLPIYAAKAFGKLKDPTQIKEGTFLHRLMKMFGPGTEPQEAQTETVEEGSPDTQFTGFDLMTELEAMKSYIDPSKDMFDVNDPEIKRKVEEIKEEFKDQTFSRRDKPTVMAYAASYILGEDTYRAEVRAKQEKEAEEARQAEEERERQEAAERAPEDEETGDYKNLTAIDYKPYTGKYEVTPDHGITIARGKLKIDEVQRVNINSPIIIEYSKGKKDTIEHFAIAEKFLEANNYQFKIGRPIQRTNITEPLPTDKADQYNFKESTDETDNKGNVTKITFTQGVRLKGLRRTRE